MEKLSNEQVKAIVESEGISYAVTEYLSPFNILDKELSELWSNVATSLKDILKYLGIEE